MSNESGTAEQLPEAVIPEVSTNQVADYLERHPDFFITHQELLADLTLPHESGEAVSLMERQISILRGRDHDARIKLNTLLNNARDNDQIFEITRNIVLALLHARDISEIVQVTEDKLRSQENIDACEIILVKERLTGVPDSVRSVAESELNDDYADVFRLKRTYCGSSTDEKLEYLFGAGNSAIKSTALCPIMANNQMYALLAIGNTKENYFNINLDTVFLDFIGSVIATVLSRKP